MALAHPITGTVYEPDGNGLVKVTDKEGRVGFFTPTGRHVSGELRHADPHMIDWVGMPQATSPGRLIEPAAEV